MERKYNQDLLDKIKERQTVTKIRLSRIYQIVMKMEQWIHVYMKIVKRC